jgi:hypothetical protein
MQRALLNRATMRVADTMEVSGRVTADEVNLDRIDNRIRKVCALVAATLILPALAYAQNNQGNGPGINPGVPNGTYVGTESGWVPSFTPTQHPVVDGQVPVVEAGRETFIPTGTTNGLAFGTTSGVSAFSAGGQVFTGVTFAGTFTVNADGSVSATSTILTPFQETLHFKLYPSPDGNTIAFVQTDPGATINGVMTRH